MPLASYQSTEAALSELGAVFSDEAQSESLCLLFRRKTTGEEIFRVGGRWHRRKKDWIDGTVDAVCIDVNDNQVAICRAFSRHLTARINGEPRRPFLITGGNRRGGKSWIITALALANAIAIPNAIVWMVSPVLDKREELERYLKAHAAPGWLTPKVREFKFTLPNGSTIKNITGDDDEALKRGEADLVLYNEPQLMRRDVLTNGAPAVIDQGGLVLFAGNPASKRKGVWFTRLWLAVESGKYPHGEVYRLDRRDNPDVDKTASKQVSDLLAVVDPQAHKFDDEGIFQEPGQWVYQGSYDENRNQLSRLPDITHQVCTAALIRKRGVISKQDILCGADFQANYGNAGVEVVAVGDVDAPTYYVVKCHVREGDETYFLDDAFELWPRERTLWVGDASGTWQDAAHIKGRDSFTKFEARRWKIIPPREKISDRGKSPANPPVPDRVNLVNKLLADGRLIVCMDGAADVAQALRECEYGTTRRSESRPSGRYSHLTDALGYVLYWAEPKAKKPQRLPGAGDVVPIARTPHRLRTL